MSKEKVVIVPNNTEVVRSRDFGRVKGHLTRNQRVGFASLLKNAYLITLEEDNPQMRDFEVPLSTILKDMNINHHNIFEDSSETTVSLVGTLKKLMDKRFEWRFKRDGKIVREGASAMISEFDVDKDTNIAKFTLTKFVHDRLLCYGNAYISEMPIISSFKSSYAVALHEQLEQRKSFHKWKVSVKEFRELMGIMEDEYNRIYDLKRWCIGIAIDEIEKNTEYFNLKYTNEKSGKTITHFVFTWGLDKKEKEHQGQSNMADIDSQIEELKTKVFEINNANYKLIDIRQSDEYSEFVATVENSKEQQGKIKLKTDIQESIDMMKGYIV